MEKGGAKYYNDIILMNAVGTGAIRARKSMRYRKVVHLHQNVMVFFKGDPKTIKDNFNPLTDYFDALEDSSKMSAETIEMQCDEWYHQFILKDGGSMLEQTKILKDKAEKGRTLYRSGNIDIKSAKELVMPYLNAVNAKAKELAKKYNQCPHTVTFRAYVRQGAVMKIPISNYMVSQPFEKWKY